MNRFSVASASADIWAKQALAVGLVLGLSACGGGGSDGGNDSAVTTQQPTQVVTPSTTPSSVTNNPTPSPAQSSTPTSPTHSSTNRPEFHDKRGAEQVAVQMLSEGRKSCGFGALSVQANLSRTAANHAHYLVWASQINQQAIASHHESVMKDSQGKTLLDTGITNPFFSGANIQTRLNPTTLGSRAQPTKYETYRGIVSESLAMATYGSLENYPSIDSEANAKTMLLGLLAAPYHLRSMVMPLFSQIGVSYTEGAWSKPPYYYNQSILELVLSRPASDTPKPHTTVLSYPCEGTTTVYELTHEDPNPFGNQRDLATRPIGQPIYILAPEDKTIKTASASIKRDGQSVAFVHVLTKDNDPNQFLAANEVIFMPDVPLQPASAYQVQYDLTYTTGERVSKQFTFRTIGAAG